MRIAIIGATGGVGRELVSQALGHGHEVRALARGIEKLDVEHERLVKIAGDVMTGAGLAEAIRGSKAVLMTVGGNPGRDIRVYSDGAHNVIKAMRESGTDRLVAVSAAGVGAPNDPNISLFNRLVIMKFVLRGVLDDMERMENEIMLSDVNWTIVRPPQLTDGPLTGEYRVAPGRSLPKSKQLSRADLAAFMLKAVGIDLWDGKGVAIGY